MIMFKTLSFSLALALISAPAFAQQMGSTNSKAPTCTQGLEFADGGKISVTYKAITWADGKTMAALAADGEQGNAMRERFNKTAASRPLGSVKTTTDLTMSGRTIKAGDYDMFFTVMNNDGNTMWLCNLQPKGNADAQPLRWRLALQPSEHKMPRLLISLHAGEKDTDAGVYLAFGEESCMVNLSCAKAEKKDGEK